MSKHTPGPWEVHKPHRTEKLHGVPSKRVYPQNSDTLVAVVFGNRNHDEIRNNALLIAAAPEMAEVLKEYEKWEAALILDDESWSGAMPTLTYELYDWMIRLQDKRNAVLAKARGEEGK